MLWRGGNVPPGTALSGFAPGEAVQVFDLRSHHEQQRHPSALAHYPQALRAHTIDLGAPVQILRRAGATTDQSRAAMIDLYAALPRVFAPVFRAVFLGLAAGSGPAFVHCAVGKDRTGVTVGLILAALGAAPEAIMADYHASNAAQAAITANFGTRHPDLRGASDPVQAPLTIAHPEYLRAFFDVLGTSRSAIESYLRGSLGLDDVALDGLRKRLLS